MWQKVILLLWKSLQLRKRHWLNTIIEIILPSILVYAMCYIKTKNEFGRNGQTILNSTSEKGLFNYFDDIGMEIVCYTLNTSENQFMKEFREKLNSSYITIQKAQNEDEIIKKITKKEVYLSIGIIFKEIRKLQVFKYKVILGINTKKYKKFPIKLFKEVTMPPLYKTPKHLRNLDDTKHFELFMLLQLTLNKAFISWSTPANNSLNINDYNLQIKPQPCTSFIGYDNFQETFQYIIPTLTIICFLLVCPYTIHRISEEKESGVTELMKMMGLKSWMIWTGWILHNSITYAISITIITYLFCNEIFSGYGKLLIYTNPLLLWIFLAMYIVTQTFFSFAICSLFNTPLIALMVGDSTWFLSYILPIAFMKPYTSITIKLFLMLFPNVAVINAFTAISLLESNRQGLQLTTLFTTGKEYNNISVGFVLFMFIFDCLLYGFVAWYFDAVMPGKYGIAKPVNFFCKWFNKNTESFDMVSYKIDSILFENPPYGYEVGISVNNLHKCFGDVYAINGVNLNLYKGQITVLLGHNGAGKTTFMSILTGFLSSSYGSVQFNGNDLFSNIDRLREYLGFCPQHSLLFSHLTTQDHLIFFGMLKGLKLEHAKSESMNLLKHLNILQKKNELVDKLSGGIKRKLSLAIALIGSPEVLILDEPTSGMDAESRRAVWDLILSYRETRTILITTQFMEEADFLGDRIAIMDHGQIICYGTPLFLKKAYGSFYKLTIVKEVSICELTIIAAIKTITPEAEICSLKKQIVVNLPQENTDQLFDLFRMLEINRTKFSLKGLGVSCSTIEDVFLSSSKYSREDLRLQSHTNISDFEQTLMAECTSEINLLKNQFKVLLKKKVLYTYRRWLITLIFGSIPNVLGFLAIISPIYFFNTFEPNKTIELSLNTIRNKSVYYRAGDNSSENLKPIFMDITKENQYIVNESLWENDIINGLLKMCNQVESKYRTDILIAGDFNKKNLTLIYNRLDTYAPGIAINLYANAVLRKLSGNNKSYISTTYESTNRNNYDHDYGVEIYINFCTSGFLYLIGFFIAFPLDERLSGIKHLQLMTNLSPIMYWTTCFIWDYFCYIIVVIFTLIVIYFIDIKHIYTDSNQLAVLLTLLLIYGWSSILFAYVYSFFNKNLLTSILLFIMINFIIEIFLIIVNYFPENYKIITDKINYYTNIIYNMKYAGYIILIIPQFLYPLCIEGFIELVKEKKECQDFLNYTITHNLQMERIDTEYESKCREFIPATYSTYFTYKASEYIRGGILKETLILVFSSLLYIVLILLFEYNIFARLYKFSFNKFVGTVIGYKDENEDSNIRDEREKVDAAKSRSNDKFLPLLIIDDLVKKFTFKFTGVRGISFVVSPGECFGLLGTNGAGKTTIFQILTGDIYASNGDASINFKKLYKLSTNINQYLPMIGYCPQFDAINSQLTGREMLHLMAILRCVSPSHIENYVNKWIKLMGLEECENRLCGKYSGGDKRKLNTAMALIGDPPVVLLDEPTSGVDPVTKRKLWKILDACKKVGQAIIFTSHSMDECEAVCDRLTIMVDGVMKCIDNIQYLKSRYGQGFTVMVKLHSNAYIRLPELKLYIKRQFGPDIHLKDEHTGLLHYHISNQHIPLSKIFGKIKTIKKYYTEIEHFTVNDTTLEQIFIAFAKGQAVRNTTA